MVRKRGRGRPRHTAITTHPHRTTSTAPTFPADTLRSARARYGSGIPAAAFLLAGHVLLGRWEGPSGTRPRDSFRSWIGFRHLDKGIDRFVSRSLPPELHTRGFRARRRPPGSRSRRRCKRASFPRQIAHDTRVFSG